MPLDDRPDLQVISTERFAGVAATAAVETATGSRFCNLLITGGGGA
jgi:hypothetical protein